MQNGSEQDQGALPAAHSPQWKDFSCVVESRRSIREFDGSPIPAAVVRDCLRLALLAPSSGNLQQCEIHWLRDPRKKREAVGLFVSQRAVTTCGELFVVFARTATWERNRSLLLEELRRRFDRVPAQLIRYYQRVVPAAYRIGPLGLGGRIKRLIAWIAGLRGVFPTGATSRADLDVWAAKSAALACQNFMLALRAAGYDSCPMEGADWPKVRRFLGLPGDAVPVMGIAAGRASPDRPPLPRIRLDPSLFIKEV